MQIHLDDLSENAEKHLQFQLEDESFSYMGTEMTLQDLSFDGVFSRKKAEVTMTGSLKGSVRTLCARCLGPAAADLDVQVSVRFIPGGDEEAEDAVFAYESGLIEPDDALRQEAVLNMPSRILCRPDCKGLCPTCGADLNEGPCACVPEDEINPKFAALKNFRFE